MEFYNGNLANHIESENKTRTKNRSDMNIPKSFSGNIVMFGNSPDQYGKRFKRNSCCGIVRASEADKVEKKEEVFSTGGEYRIVHSNGAGIEHIDTREYWIDNMITWEHAGSKATICSCCGWIDSERSNIEQVQQETTKEQDNEPTAEELAELEKALPELIA